ncbi:MAG TPA: hypothetical protein VES40_03455 [Ilumatobacteraceae bacterium]|nr:hypothetical protein [Ilumatobacteraceae bacterium]
MMRHELTSLEAAIGMPLRTVELALPHAEIARRIISDPTDGRRADLAGTASWTTQKIGSGLADVTMTNDRSVRVVALEILDWLDWLPRFD